MAIEPAIFETGSQSANPYTMQPDQSRIDGGEGKFTVYKSNTQTKILHLLHWKSGLNVYRLYRSFFVRPKFRY